MRNFRDNDDFESQFTSDGKLNFKARVGLDRSQDPLKKEHYPADSTEFVAFDEHRRFMDRDEDYRSSRFDEDDDDDYQSSYW